ncbi:MAG: hypothetical protein OER22_14935 [Gammaproteobacteria bacterium]|nr:hypothetical protein [Gammaproteobacteria bacterium]MDH3374522.1 hypothetical protein [Gammaproteobacteria bacterium]MDH3410218.1 hypothetical protein [Gammaproteobacteria bacterium]MDH3553906.1 hypothetical protein [Gammaproteobacteria bacterium]
MKKILNLLPAGLVLALATGCVNTELMADVDPSADLVGLDTFYVAKFGPDERGIEAMIAAELNAMGKTATSGADPKPPAPVDAVVTYEDKWMWDMTMYMIELSIDLRDPETNYKFATGRSYRTSLARKKPEAMVAEVLGEIFGTESSGAAE